MTATYFQLTKRVLPNVKLLIDRFHVVKHMNHYEYKTWRSFRTPKYPLLTEAMMIDRLLAFSTPLKEAYTVFHELTEAFRHKNFILFFYLLKELPETMDDRFRAKLQNLLSYEEGITNALISPYSNEKNRSKESPYKDNQTCSLRI